MNGINMQIVWKGDKALSRDDFLKFLSEKEVFPKGYITKWDFDQEMKQFRLNYRSPEINDGLQVQLAAILIICQQNGNVTKTHFDLGIEKSEFFSKKKGKSKDEKIEILHTSLIRAISKIKNRRVLFNSDLRNLEKVLTLARKEMMF
jgi:hypothetical protein